MDKIDRQILAQLADGLTNDQIGARLHMSPDTVKVRIKNLAASWGVRGNRAGLVAEAMRKGIIG
ncbi:response regulator transcription factor [Actinopolyspora halophila]|uniref:response regulator transcription factor n=1 Tax=Actinopolyspora halophila TaxID=1850 RepID=UPI00037AFA94|nr:helix-turn-helix transcriptional regulator [Actinopolyspora halophila]